MVDKTPPNETETPDWSAVSPKIYDIHTMEFYQAYARNTALRNLALKENCNPFRIHPYRSSSVSPDVGVCLFLAPAGSEAKPKDWTTYYDRDHSKKDLQNHLMERSSEAGKSWWDAYVKNTVALCTKYNTAIVLSRNILDAVTPELPKDTWIYVTEENPRRIGQGASTRYMLADHHSLFYTDLDAPMAWVERSYKATMRVKGKGDFGLVRQTSATKPDAFYRGVLGSRLWIKHTEQEGYSMEEVCTGHVVCNLAHGHADTTFAWEPNSRPADRFGEIYPRYCYDEYMLHTLLVPHFARLGRLGTLDTTIASGPAKALTYGDPRHAADKAYSDGFEGNLWVDWNGS